MAISNYLVRFCEQHAIQFTRGRPYKKDDNAHIEQKNWTHVRKVMGWERYDTPRALAATWLVDLPCRFLPKPQHGRGSRRTRRRGH